MELKPGIHPKKPHLWIGKNENIYDNVDIITAVNEAGLDEEGNQTIENTTTFNAIYKSYMGNAAVKGNGPTLHKRVIQQYFEIFIGPKDKKLFKKAGGKNLRQDRQTTAKNIVVTKEDYVRRGAQRVDLDKFDTKSQQQVLTKEIIKREFKLQAIIKGKVVRTYRDSIVVKGRTQIRFRDRLGRFGSRTIPK